MHYPYMFLNRELKKSPLFPEFQTEPLILNLSSEGDFLKNLPPGDQRAFQHKLNEWMTGKYEWGLSPYLEHRETLLSTCPQMVEEERFYHLGLDIIVPADTKLHCPLTAVVKDAGYEEGRGNYGGYILLEHSAPEFETFYTLYGHLNPNSLAPAGTKLAPGEVFGLTGEFDENGSWFYHTHLQILTFKGLAQNMQFKGYCRSEDLKQMDRLCPSPAPLFISTQYR